MDFVLRYLKRLLDDQSCVNDVIQTSTPSIAILAPDLVQAFFVFLDIHHEATFPGLYFLCLCWNLT